MNPIKTVDGKTVKCPDKYKPDLSDLSASDAGRVEAGRMDKMQIGQTSKFAVGWLYPNLEEGSEILNLFTPEYTFVTLLDPLSGGFRTSEFYAGDRDIGEYIASEDRWEYIKFNIIEREVY